MPRPRLEIFRVATLAFATLLAVAMVVYVPLWALDFLPTGAAPSPLSLFAEPGAANSFAGLGEVTVAVLGIAITVVAIIVELAANRYTPRITDLFVRDPVNVTMLGFFVVTALLVVWVEMSLYGPTYPAGLVLGATVMISVSLLLLLPYFAYVFDFLTPTRVVHRIQDKSARAMHRARNPANARDARQEAIQGIDQLGDIALNSVDKKDKAISIAAVNAMRELFETGLELKPDLPEAWFETTDLAEEDPDFVAFHHTVIESLRERRTWLEMKILRQYQAIVLAALSELRDVNHLISIRTRQLAVVAAERRDEHVTQLLLRFTNTYLRAALNRGDVRTAYNLFNEVRALAEDMHDIERDDIVVEIAWYLRFYGHLAFGMQLGFIQEVTAYDMCTLIEYVVERDGKCQDQLLDILLEVDKEPAAEGVQETSLRGVRKAQIKLATFYLSRGDEERARRIWEDMKHEPPDRMRSIRQELNSIEAPEYWEVSDRGINFDWIPDPQRQYIDRFFTWFTDIGLKDSSPAAR